MQNFLSFEPMFPVEALARVAEIVRQSVEAGRNWLPQVTVTLRSGQNITGVPLRFARFHTDHVVTLKIDSQLVLLSVGEIAAVSIPRFEELSKYFDRSETVAPPVSSITRLEAKRQSEPLLKDQFASKMTINWDGFPADEKMNGHIVRFLNLLNQYFSDLRSDAMGMSVWKGIAAIELKYHAANLSFQISGSQLTILADPGRAECFKLESVKEIADKAF